MKKFTMLGVPLLVFLAAMTQASFSAETKKQVAKRLKFWRSGRYRPFKAIVPA